MEDEYTEVVRQFYAVYEPLQKKYNLRAHIQFRMNDDGEIEIWQFEGEIKKRYVCKVEEREDIDCFKRAIEELELYKKEREESEHGRDTAMAV